jgi:hypothetical protein
MGSVRRARDRRACDIGMAAMTAAIALQLI